MAEMEQGSQRVCNCKFWGRDASLKQAFESLQTALVQRSLYMGRRFMPEWKKCFWKFNYIYNIHRRIVEEDKAIILKPVFWKYGGKILRGNCAGSDVAAWCDTGGLPGLWREDVSIKKYSQSVVRSQNQLTSLIPFVFHLSYPWDGD